MGRPIKKIFIGERGAGNAGGEGVASVTVVTADSASFVEGELLVIDPPDLEGGIQAAGYILVTAGAVTGTVITEEGSGYTSTSDVGVTTAGGTGAPVLTTVLTTDGVAVIGATAYIPGGASAKTADILAQKATRTYRVTTADGTGECELVARAFGEGEMAIIATDSDTNTYYVSKLMNRTVILTQESMLGTAYEFENNAKVKWGDTAIANDTVKVSV